MSALITLEVSSKAIEAYRVQLHSQMDTKELSELLLACKVLHQDTHHFKTI